MKLQITYIDQNNQEQIVVTEVEQIDYSQMTNLYEQLLGFVPSSVQVNFLE